jgi:hypothetical protein
MRRSLLMIASILLFVAGAFADSNPVTRLTGDWVMAFRSGDTPRAYVLVFQPESQGFSGFVQWVYGGEKFPMTETSIAGDTFSFKASGTAVVGKVVSADALVLKFNFAKEDQIVTAKRAAGFSKHVAEQYEGVSQSQMGVYRALARLAYEAVQQHDMHRAATFAYLLERTWDRGEDGLRKSNRDVWLQIDRAMDGIVRPIVADPYLHMDAKQFKRAYATYTEKLKVAEDLAAPASGGR